ncbi:EF hand [Cupriavidus sp. YR651]|uniref:EF-hand domain-containing protein n=1 Tax=Cupriavidus sp. YR651 TaxID=1855315 RepID=UPI00088A3F97|nr:EF-hand domain-containing protein [Cupriavidus sp. YR651]SDD18312.1 EF hand [Cupriavidus sp. YR651]
MQRNHKTHILKNLLAASAVLLMAGGAFAQTAAPAPSTAPAPQAAPQGGMSHHHMGGPGEHHGGGMWLKSVDTDGDGTISKAEADALFNKIDTNHDGKLDKAELAAYHKAAWEQRRAQMKTEFEAKFKAADKNNDGALTRDEMKAAFPRMVNRFDQIDANHDGKVTMAEIESGMQKMHQQRMQRRGPGASAPAVPSGSGN